MNHAIIYQEPDLSNAIKGDFVMRIPCEHYWDSISNKSTGILPIKFSIGDTLIGLCEGLSLAVWSYQEEGDYDSAQEILDTHDVRHTVADIQVQKLGDMGNNYRHKMEEEWNATHPDNPYDPDLYCWTIKLTQL